MNIVAGADAPLLDASRAAHTPTSGTNASTMPSRAYVATPIVAAVAQPASERIRREGAGGRITAGGGGAAGGPGGATGGPGGGACGGGPGGGPDTGGPGGGADTGGPGGGPGRAWLGYPRERPQFGQAEWPGGTAKPHLGQFMARRYRDSLLAAGTMRPSPVARSGGAALSRHARPAGRVAPPGRRLLALRRERQQLLLAAGRADDLGSRREPVWAGTHRHHHGREAGDVPGRDVRREPGTSQHVGAPGPGRPLLRRGWRGRERRGDERVVPVVGEPVDATLPPGRAVLLADEAAPDRRPTQGDDPAAARLEHLHIEPGRFGVAVHGCAPGGHASDRQPGRVRRIRPYRVVPGTDEQPGGGDRALARRLVRADARRAPRTPSRRPRRSSPGSRARSSRTSRWRPGCSVRPRVPA